MSKQRKQDPLDYSVMALEALWWVEDGTFDITHPDNWSWTAMILQPEHITREMYNEALEQLRRKKPSPGLERLRFEVFEEDLSLQMMHIGPYAEEPRTVEKIHACAEQQGFKLHGKHHEIYLGDPRRSDPAKLKTVLRHPVTREKVG
jgi:hypothetical protein